MILVLQENPSKGVVSGLQLMLLVLLTFCVDL